MAGFEATHALLAGNATYTSGVLMSETYDTLVGIVYASHGGTLYVDQSVDGTNWDLTSSNSITGGTGEAINETLVGPYYRVRFVNGATDQTAFRLSFRKAASGPRG